MTPAQTQPGADLDAAVARMLGWTDVQPMSGVLYGLRPGTEYHYYKIPKYSADWGCAGLVVEHMRKLGFVFRMILFEKQTDCEFYGGPGRAYMASHASAPAAIALAALAATGGEG